MSVVIPSGAESQDQGAHHMGLSQADHAPVSDLLSLVEPVTPEEAKEARVNYVATAPGGDVLPISYTAPVKNPSAITFSEPTSGQVVVSFKDPVTQMGQRADIMFFEIVTQGMSHE